MPEVYPSGGYLPALFLKTIQNSRFRIQNSIFKVNPKSKIPLLQHSWLRSATAGQAISATASLYHCITATQNK
jgi:hypothetical protein